MTLTRDEADRLLKLLARIWQSRATRLDGDIMRELLFLYYMLAERFADAGHDVSGLKIGKSVKRKVNR